LDYLLRKALIDVSNIHIADCMCDLVKVKGFIEKGTDINAKDKFGRTALHGAVFANIKNVAEFLVTKSVDINAKSKNGYTPLHVAATQGYRDVAELLIAKSADINATDNKGRTALSLAKEHGWDEVVELLRKHGAKD